MVYPYNLCPAVRLSSEDDTFPCIELYLRKRIVSWSRLKIKYHDDDDWREVTKVHYYYYQHEEMMMYYPVLFPSSPLNCI